MLVVAQRMVELRIAKRNEKWILEQGGYEVGKGHYKYIVLIHILFFVTLLVEVTYYQKELSAFAPLLFFFFALTQLVRVWALQSLGVFWNTKIMILPTSQIQVKGPYKYIKHPNYLIVALEFAILPLLFQAYATAITFSLLNLAIMAVRIPIEESALTIHKEYELVGMQRKKLITNVSRNAKRD